MAGHNKWTEVKRLKAVVAARRTKILSKPLREITAAASRPSGALADDDDVKGVFANAEFPDA